MRAVQLAPRPQLSFARGSDAAVPLVVWTAGGAGYSVAVGLKSQPSAQLYIPAGTTGTMKSISQTVSFTTPTSNVISYGAYVSSYLVSGSADNNFALHIDVWKQLPV